MSLPAHKYGPVRCPIETCQQAYRLLNELYSHLVEDHGWDYWHFFRTVKFMDVWALHIFDSDEDEEEEDDDDDNVNETDDDDDTAANVAANAKEASVTNN